MLYCPKIIHFPGYLILAIYTIVSSCNQKNTEQENPSDLTEIHVTDRSGDFDSLYDPPKSVKEIIEHFSARNEVQYEFIGTGSTKSKLYQDFRILKKIARTDELIRLTNDDNPIVRCYAGWALIDRNFSRLDSIYSSLVNSDTAIFTYGLNMQSQSTVAVEIYHHYWNSLDYKSKISDPLLVKLDSLTLYNENSHWVLILRALENRLYPKSYNSQIGHLAFDKKDIHAIIYLSNWYKAEYILRLKPALKDYLQKTDFEAAGVDYYYKVVEQLLQFRDENIEKVIKEKMKKDKFWEHDKQHFLDLLIDYNIFDSDVH